MKKDLVIKNQIEKIESALEKLENNSDTTYKYKTNLKYNEQNLRTVQSVNDLCIIYGEIKSKQDQYYIGWSAIMGDESAPDLKLYGYTVASWLEDIKNLAKSKMHIDMLNKLRQAKKKLESLYSQDAKDEIELNNIIKDLCL